MKKVLRNLQRIFTRRLGPIFRYGGKEGVQVLTHNRFGKVWGFLYFLPNGKAFRINYYKAPGAKSVKINSVHIWRNYKVQRDGNAIKADFEVDLSTSNIVQVVDKVADLVKQPKIGTFRHS